MEYGKFAEYYDLLYQKKDYKKETEFLNNFISPQSRVLDLGCGTGRHGYILEQNNCYVDGVDMSFDMLKIARGRIKGKLFCQDILKLEIDEKYDVIISMFAVFNHLKNIDELTEVFKVLENLLNTNGKIIIDLYNQRSSSEKNDEFQNIKRIMKWNYNKYDNTETSVITFEIDGKIYSNNHKFKIFEIEEIENSCRLANLRLTAIYGNYNIDIKDNTEAKNIQVIIEK